MENYLPLLQSTSLFAGISAGELRPLLSELGACIRSYGRGEALVQAGAPSRRVGVVLTGSIEAYRPAPGGARIPITHMGPGGVFGDVLGGSSLDSPVTVVASAPCEVLLFPYEKLLQPDGSAARQRLLQNLVRTISDKYADRRSAERKAEDRRNKVVNINATTQLKVVLVKPERFENASEIADHLKEKRTVVINLESTNKDIARRLIDFLSGVAYAGEGKIKKVAANTYIITPYHVDIMGDLIDELENNGLYL